MKMIVIMQLAPLNNSMMFTWTTKQWGTSADHPKKFKASRDTWWNGTATVHVRFFFVPVEQGEIYAAW